MHRDLQLEWILLHVLYGNRRALWRTLLKRFSSAAAILSSSAEQWQALDLNSSLRRVPATAERARARQLQQLCESNEVQLLALTEPGYPPLLAQIPDPPPLLYVRGNAARLAEPALAIVGSRKPSGSGSRAAREFAAAAVGAGLAVVSGLALGVDGCAHQAALSSNGVTVGVLATGIDIVYPRRHQALAESIAQRGALVSEVLPGAKPLPSMFPQRNRIVSGLSLGVLIVEAALRSGSLITARLALEQNREVFALPQSIYHPGGQGGNALLRDGATPVTEPQHLFSELGLMAQAQQHLQLPENEQLPIYAALGYEPASADELAAALGMDTALVRAQLTELQMMGKVEVRQGLFMRV